MCSHEQNDPKCTCPVPYEERKVSSFLRQKKSNECYDFYKLDGPGYVNLEFVKTLLVSGDMEPILRTCASPQNDLKSWWSLASCQCGAEYPDIGWDQVYLHALEAYICLNVLYCFPSIREHQSEEQDYRRTSCYQQVLRSSAAFGSEAVKAVHVDFFGVHDEQFSLCPKVRENGPFAHLGEGLEGWNDYPCGVMPIHDFLEFENVVPHIPTLSEVIHVSWMLSKKGLPGEITSNIMELADYEPRRRLKVPHDPFHRGNTSELERYLSLCWEVLIRCDMMAKALEDPIDWDVCVSWCIRDLWMTGLPLEGLYKYTSGRHGLCEFL